MTYFRGAHRSVRVAVPIDGKPGLRTSQIGAIHALSAHFTLRSDPGLIVLPTGAGKTAVQMLAPFVLPAKRALVITQSRFVREQIARDFASLETLKSLEAVPEGCVPPKVYENKSSVRTDADWESLRGYDVVVATPNGASPAIRGVPVPPDDLFDLVLVDEAHHSPAPTWNALIKAFPKARVVLFTATPFRRDRKEIAAKHLYTYPIPRAFDDGIYGEMSFVPVVPEVAQSADEAIALKTEEVFREDQAAGLRHSLMVRADSLSRAKELAKIYAESTGLRLETVDSSKSQRTTSKVVERLRKGELDGVICVDMLGEGFDLPRLKQAALHAPHRSLAVTLQFFGRFARMNGAALGEAKFLGVPAEMGGELAQLYQESEAWGKKVRLLGDEAIGAEIEVREFLEAFEEEDTADVEAPVQDVSLYSFTVFNHVKVHQVHGDLDLKAHPSVPGFVTEKVWVNEGESTVVALLREEVRPQWATTPGLDRIEHHLVILYWDQTAKLAFVCSSYREESLYKELMGAMVAGKFRAVTLNKLNRVLRSFSELELFNVGIRNRASGLVAESYRQISGASAHQALDKGDAALYHRGHIFGRGLTAKGASTIGLSSLGKVWRLEPTRIPELVRWCQTLAREIENPAPFTTGIAIDHFDMGSDTESIPNIAILAVDWDEQVYANPWRVSFAGPSGTEHTVSLIDLDLVPEPNAQADSIVFRLRYPGFETRLRYVVSPVPAISYADEHQPKVLAARGFKRRDFVECFSEGQLRFHLADGSVLVGAELFSPIGDEPEMFSAAELCESVNWQSENVDIQIEYGSCPPHRTIHEWLRDRLVGSDAPIVLYDHRTGECADFVVVSEGDDGKPTVAFYHCKPSGGPAAGDRVDDAYEVCGQAVKSAKFRNRRKLIQHIRRRVASGSTFLKGSLDDLVKFLEPDPRYEIPLSVFLVQPGFSQSAMSYNTSSLIGAASRALISVGCPPLRVVCSG